MNSDADERLVILGNDEAEAALLELSRRWPVAHLLSRRVVVVKHLPGHSDTEISMIPGVAAVTSTSVPPEVLSTLDETETLGAAAWTARKTEPKKARRGDGLDWDAPGFTPPDPPTD